MPGFGKSTGAIRMGFKTNYRLRHDFDIDVPKFSLKRNVLYKPETKDINDLLSAERFNVEVIDEGYLFALNLMPMDKFMVELVQTINITRSKNNALFWCFQNVERATRALRERFNVWCHKGFKERAYLFARSNIFITKDPWGTGELLKSQKDEQILFLLNNNPNKVCTFRTRPLPPKLWKEYNKYKDEAQIDIQKIRANRENVRQASDLVLNDLYEKVKGTIPTMSESQIPEYLRGTYDMDEKEVERMIRKWRDHNIMKKASKYFSKSP